VRAVADGASPRSRNHEQPDVAIIDIGLPGIDGYELASALRARFDGDLRLIALSGYGLADDLRRSSAAGFEAHLVKLSIWHGWRRCSAKLSARRKDAAVKAGVRDLLRSKSRLGCEAACLMQRGCVAARALAVLRAACQGRCRQWDGNSNDDLFRLHRCLLSF